MSEVEVKKEEPQLPDPNLQLTMEDFIGFWRQGKYLVEVRGELKPVPYHKGIEAALRKMVPMLQHFSYKDNPEVKEAVSDFFRYSPKLALAVWEKIFFFCKVSCTPALQTDQIVVNASVGLREAQKDLGLSRGLVLPESPVIKSSSN